MPCETCGEALVTGIEQKLRTCSGCLGKAVETAKDLKEANLKLQLEVEDGNKRLQDAQSFLEELEKFKQAEKDGGLAHVRGASLDDNPHDPDADVAACWAYGWLYSEVTLSTGKMQAVMMFAANMLSVVREVAAGGASGDEVAAKLDTVIDKLLPYIITEDTPATG